MAEKSTVTPQILLRRKQRKAKRLKSVKRYAIIFQKGDFSMKIVIVGGVAGGATAAARIRRLDEHAEIIIFERSGFISYANCSWFIFAAKRIALIKSFMIYRLSFVINYHYIL